MAPQLAANALALFLLAAPLVADAQPSATIPRVGVLSDFGDMGWEPLWQGLRDLGYVEGKNIVLDIRRPEERSERWPDLAADLVRLKVDIIVTGSTPATFAAKRETTTIPIIMAGVGGDPVITGLVSSLAHPGGNVTGLTFLGGGLAPKRLALLKEAVPNMSRVAFPWNPANPAQLALFKELQSAARSLGVTLQPVEVRSGEEWEGVFATIMRDRPSALYISSDIVQQAHIDRIIAFAAKSQLPAMYQQKDNVERGGLMSYGASRPHLRRRTAVYIDKILKGANPANLPVEHPTRFEFVINMKTARALGLQIPRILLLQADQVID